ncbi:MAG: rifampicin phosphotransferase [Gaiellaceae bacterium]|nr:rifampicin phosphotransferase [Gaiellaceae bacterium]
MTLLEAGPAAGPVPLPPDFPVAFAPGDEQLLWDRDRTHFPSQVTTLEAEFVSEAVADGMAHALRQYGAPVGGVKVRAINGYVYQAMLPPDVPPDALEELARRADEQILTAIGRLPDRWEEEWLPEIMGHLVAMQALTPRRAALHTLLDHLEEHRARLERLWQIHFEIVLPAYLAVSEFEELYRELFAGEQFDAYRLLHGFQSKTFEVGRDLWRLSRIALAAPDVAHVLEAEAAAGVIPRLESIPAAHAFLTELRRHLAAYGHRTATWGLASPTFIEDPAPVITVIKDYIGRPDSADPGCELERLAREREVAVAEARERLRGYPAAVVQQFEAMLGAAQVGLVLTEDHGFYIDAWGVSLARELLSEIGGRLVADGTLDEADDVLMLTYDELRMVGLEPVDHRRLIADRRAALAPYASVAPPPLVGTLPPGPPPDGPMTRLAAKFAGAPAASTEPGVVTGTAGSGGTATGVARVVRSLEDAARLKPGDVLVAETTAPSWTPLFAVACAVVTDTGGILSHCAVVAREYAIPAVVGTADGTVAIADGDLIEVDGDAGTVRVLVC